MARRSYELKESDSALDAPADYEKLDSIHAHDGMRACGVESNSLTWVSHHVRQGGICVRSP